MKGSSIIVPVDPERLRPALIHKLSECYNLETFEGNKDGLLRSYDAKSNLFNSLIKGKPTEISWRVDETEQNFSIVQIVFSLPRYLKIQVYLLIGMLGVLGHLSGLITNRIELIYVDTKPPLDVAMALIILSLLCGLMFIIIAVLLSFVKIRYINSFINLVKDLMKDKRQDNEVEFIDKGKWHNLYLDVKLFIFLTLTILSLAFFYSVDISILITKMGLPVLLPIFLLIVLFSLIYYSGTKGKVYAFRLLPLGYDLCIFFCIFALSISYPTSISLFVDNPELFDKAAMISIMVILIPFIFVFTAVFIAGALGYITFTHISGFMQKDIQENTKKTIFKVAQINSKKISTGDIGEVPKTLKIMCISIFLYLLLLIIYAWGIDLSMVLSVLWPTDSSIFNIREMLDLFAYTWVGTSTGFCSIIVTILFIIPMLAPLFIMLFSVMVFLYIHNKKKRRFYVKDENLISKVDEIANDMGVKDVICVLDPDSNSISPRAEISGFRPKNMILFSKQSLEFLSQHQNYQIPIIAHEVAHLNKHCHKIRFLRILSRICLIGPSFFSIFINSMKIENEADEEAAKYLESKGIDINSLMGAICTIDYFINPPQIQLSFHHRITAFSFEKGYMKMGSFHQPKSRLSRIAYALRYIICFYFEADPYDFICLPPEIRLSNIYSISKKMQDSYPIIKEKH
ncbi:MAG: hypothetical protein JXA96_13145 [Sedimentisphaerales bacterium]|nr:hypothetical protein [Sedimentisphaerales bacterium]